MEKFGLDPVGCTATLSESRILAIDDNRDFRDFLEVFLAKSNCHWKIASNMGDFKRAYHELKPTVVLLDMIMPGTDGFEVMEWLIGQAYASKLVILSGSNPLYTDAAMRLGLAHGLADVFTLQKPVHLTDLRAALGIT